MSYATTHGGHDAEWLLQHERVNNDRQMQAARAGRVLVSPKNPVRSVGHVAELAPWMEQAASRFVRRSVDADAVDEVLAMLGLETS